MYIHSSGWSKSQIYFIHDEAVTQFSPQHINIEESVPSRIYFTNTSKVTYFHFATLPTYILWSKLLHNSLYPIPQHYSTAGVPLYVNSASDIVRKCMGTPSIASTIARYPTVRKETLTWVMLCMYRKMVITVCLYREMFHGSRWLEDPRFFSPMISTPNGSVFVQDFVNFYFVDTIRLGRIWNFFFQVSHM